MPPVTATFGLRVSLAAGRAVTAPGPAVGDSHRDGHGYNDSPRRDLNRFGVSGGESVTLHGDRLQHQMFWVHYHDLSITHCPAAISPLHIRRAAGPCFGSIIFRLPIARPPACHQARNLPLNRNEVLIPGSVLAARCCDAADLVWMLRGTSCEAALIIVISISRLKTIMAVILPRVQRLQIRVIMIL